MVLVYQHTIYNLSLVNHKKRREKYVRDAMIWETGGLLGTGDIDLEKAAELYSKACSLSDCLGCYYLSQMYLKEKGGSKDEKKANELQSKAEEVAPYKFKELQQQYSEKDKLSDYYKN